MSLARVRTRAQLGLDAPAVTVEVHLSPGLPGLAIVGLPEAAVRESKDRVRSALINSGFEFPQRRITINLAPADLPKFGGRFDLPIALGILAANGQLPLSALNRAEFMGELALSGDLCPIPGVLPASLAARDAGHALFVPLGNAGEAARPHGAEVYGGDHLLAVVAHLNGLQRLPLAQPATAAAAGARPVPDMADVKGQ
ncbi:MAG: magnesium chelatase domain-containing protein, partial [Gammaproteobacteria bacterium]